MKLATHTYVNSKIISEQWTTFDDIIMRAVLMQDVSIRRSLSTTECKVKRSYEPVPDHTHALTSHSRPCTVHTIHSTHRQDINLNNMAFSTVTTF